MNYYSTKYALSSGKINIIEDHDNYELVDGYVYVQQDYSQQQFVVGRDCFKSEDEARIAANLARQKKIESLKKQIIKLEKMKFLVVPI